LKAIDLAIVDNQKKMKAELEFVYSVVIIMSILEVFINLIGMF